ncbi:MAG: DUF4369 domain-containing protein [Chitinophagaceae bacterium]|nr:DUF4369 domain-containing protein [Chitinophagaceae bacterium]
MMHQHIYKLLLGSIVFLFFSCGEKKNTFKINLSVQNSPAAQMISLIGKDYGQSPLLLDTATIAAGNSTHSFETVVSSPGIYSLTFGNDGRYILLSNDESVINLSVDWNKFSDYNISSPASASLKKLLINFNGYLHDIDLIRKDTTQNHSDSILNVKKAQIEQKTSEAKQYLTQFTDSTKNPALAIYALGILQQQQNDSVTMKPLINRLAARFPADEAVIKLNTDYQAWLKKQREIPVSKPDSLLSLPDSAK